ncbi:hypothetical protein R3P38DRAFT_3240548 [Favolaschia claudopus]|uniref:Uncharacterized protein n=1 Tax=Favolaschia claudopus TaxID=2862362 RepID=A0AAV9Z6C5_9AGAR
MQFDVSAPLFFKSFHPPTLSPLFVPVLNVTSPTHFRLRLIRRTDYMPPTPHSRPPQEHHACALPAHPPYLASFRSSSKLHVMYSISQRPPSTPSKPELSPLHTAVRIPANNTPASLA